MNYKNIYNIIKPFTLCSEERTLATIDATEYIIKNNIPGDIIECGVWRGGQVIAIILTLNELNITNRQIYLYDTFAGMPPPGVQEPKAIKKFKKFKYQADSGSNWCRAEIEEVKNNINKFNYNTNNIHFIKGKVEDTIPNNYHKSIALLRIDTDWYSSHKVILNNLCPLISKNGVLLLDDYNFWEGAKIAVDSYFSNIEIKLTADNIGAIIKL
jgi:hypothetical protein